MIRENREYRNTIMFEVVPDNDYVVEGYATTFDIYDLFESDGITYKERIMPDAFEGCDMHDVVFIKDHQGTVFARTKNATLMLSVDEHGLKVRADLSKTASARAMYEEIQAGMYSQMSFSFVVDADAYDQQTHLRSITHIKKLFDVSPVTFPANNNTDISVATRSRFDGFIEEERADLLKREKALALAKAKFEFMEV